MFPFKAGFSKPQFLGGPRDGESAETVDTIVSIYTSRYFPDSTHVYLKRVDGHYDYSGVRPDPVEGGA